MVEDVDIEFGKVIDLVRRGYRLKRQDWLNGSVNIAVAEAEVEKNNYDGWIDATDKEKIEFLTKQAEFYKERAGYLEGLLNIRRENEKVNYFFSYSKYCVFVFTYKFSGKWTEFREGIG